MNGSDYSWGFSNFPEFQSVDICGCAGINCAGGANAGLNQEFEDGVTLVTPEPTSLLLLGTGLAFAGRRLRRR